jgi:hypothetical protein
MFQGKDIERLVKLLQRRRVLLHHACQLQDFKSYLQVGGIPSRALLESRGLDFTAFSTDQKDKNNSVWDKVFGNLSDFGWAFSNGSPGVPTVYGPILLQINPIALLDATDVAICLHSAGRQGFDRNQESLKLIDDVERLFKFPLAEAKGQQELSRLKSRKELQAEFSRDHASAPEFSCTVDSGMLSIRHVRLARIDSFSIQDVPLKNHVERLKQGSNAKFPIYVRDDGISYRNELLDKLIRSEEIPSLATICADPSTSLQLKDWAQKVLGRGDNLKYQFDQFARYLLTGTIQPLMRGEIH